MSTTTRFATALLLILAGSPDLVTAQEPVEPPTTVYVHPIYQVAYRATTPAAAAPRDVAGAVAPEAAPSAAEEHARSCPYCAQRAAAAASATVSGSPTATATASGDPYGFAAILNTYRAQAGLPPVAYDPNLAAWAAQNNTAQSHRGIGHHINPNCFQNCGWNYQDALSVARGWMNSPGHRRNMLSPSITRFGIAYGPGPYWTMNAM